MHINHTEKEKKKEDKKTKNKQQQNLDKVYVDKEPHVLCNFPD